MEYVIRNMSVLIPCQQPSFSNITINFRITKNLSQELAHMWHSSFCSFFIISFNHFIKCLCTLGASPLVQIYQCIQRTIFIKDCYGMLNRKFNCIICEVPSVHVTSKHLSYNIKYKELKLSFCSTQISSKQTEALNYLGTTFWVRIHKYLGHELEIFL